MADIIVNYTLGQTGFERYNALLANLFREVADLDFNAIRRDLSSRSLIEECKDLSKQRNQILHRGWIFPAKDAAAASEISHGVYELLVEPMIKALGLYIFDDGIISRTQYRTVMSADGHRVSAVSITFRAGEPVLGYAKLSNGKAPVPPGETARP